MTDTLLSTKNLRMWFPIKSASSSGEKKYVKAVNDVSLDVKKGETLGIVGESGCGKTTLCRTIIRLLQPSSGEILYNGQDISQYTESQMRPLRKDLQIIFQDPYSSLDPRMTVGDIIAEPYVFQKMYTKAERYDKAREIMELCGLDPIYLRRYPHEFSGGQRQRIGIARALALTPKLIMCDEPVSALDVSIQSQIINLLMDLQERASLTYMFISHNLNVVYHISNRIAVMYLGFVVELGNREDIYFNTAHPYTKVLLESIPNIDFEAETIHAPLKGDLPSPVNLPKGCVFCTRCAHARERCKQEIPQLRQVGDGHMTACHFAEELS